MKKPEVLVWDLGNVLVRWDPRRLFSRLIDDPLRLNFFLEQVCSGAWHHEVDGGKSTKEATSEARARYPEWTTEINAFYERWTEMFDGPIEGSVLLLERFRQQGRKQYALSNWSEELFGRTRPDFPFMEWFDGLVLSGTERCCKPEPRLYQILFDRHQLEPSDCVFIDDRAENVETARTLGMQGIVFHDPAQLETEFRSYGLF